MDSESGSALARVRVSDAERDAVVARLNDATGEGRLSLEEFTERVSAALAARTQGDLDVLVEDLPKTGAVLGTVKLDLRQAEFAAPAVSLRVQTVVGSVKIWVPRGVAVEVEGHTVVGTRGIVDDGPARPGAPVLRLRIDTVVGSVKVYRD